MCFDFCLPHDVYFDKLEYILKDKKYNLRTLEGCWLFFNCFNEFNIPHRIFNILIVIGQRRYKDTDEHYHATEKDLQPSLHVSTHRGNKQVHSVVRFAESGQR